MNTCNQSQVDNLEDKGNRLMQAGRHAEAVLMFSEALDLCSGLSLGLPILNSRATAHFRQSNSGTYLLG